MKNKGSKTFNLRAFSVAITGQSAPPRTRPLLIGLSAALCSSAAFGDTSSGVLRGYTGSALSGYTGSGLSGYTGSGLSGYTGSGLTSVSSGQRASRAIPTCSSFGEGFTSAAMGPVETAIATDDNTTIKVLGQMFELQAGDEFAVGDYVVAAQLEGQTRAIAYPVGLPYVPGVSAVRIKATASSADLNAGQVAFGPTRVDFTPLLSAAPLFAPQPNDLLVFAGIQPMPGGVVLAGPDSSVAVRCSGLDGRM